MTSNDRTFFTVNLSTSTGNGRQTLWTVGACDRTPQILCELMHENYPSQTVINIPENGDGSMHDKRLHNG
jgi:hypothetical protein